MSAVAQRNPTPKKNSSDLTHYIWEGSNFTFKNKIKYNIKRPGSQLGVLQSDGPMIRSDGLLASVLFPGPLGPANKSS